MTMRCFFGFHEWTNIMLTMTDVAWLCVRCGRVESVPCPVCLKPTNQPNPECSRGYHRVSKGVK